MQAVDDSSIINGCETAILYVETNLLSVLLNIESKAASVRWEDNVVACNRAARFRGVRDHLNYVAALELCPDLIIFGPEHIVRLNVAVTDVNNLLKTYCTAIERVSLDECYLEFSKKIDDDLGRDGFLEDIRRLGICIRSSLNALAYDCHVGVSTSKLLARLASEKNPKDLCCVNYPENAKNLLEYEELRNVFPSYLLTKFNRFGINSTMDIRSMSVDSLVGVVGKDNAVYLKNLSYGIDLNCVVPRDLWRLVLVEYEIREKFCILLQRLFALAEDDGRIPLALKVSVRKLDPHRNTCSKEAKTAPIPCGAIKPAGRVSNEIIVKLMNIVMTHFNRLVDTSRPFQLSLLGLAFVRFHDQSPRMSHMPLNFQSPRSVASCLLRKRELSVETKLNIIYDGSGCRDSDVLPLPRIPSDLSDIEDLTPLQKKAKLDILIKTKKLHEEEMDLCSPSKLKVADLSIADDINKKPRSVLQC